MMRMIEAAMEAREGNTVSVIRDAADRMWRIGPSVDGAQACVLIQARRGPRLHERRIAADTFTAEAASLAVTALEEALP